MTAPISPAVAPAPGPEPAAATSFTGRARRRTTRSSVKIVNVLMKYLICTGGIGVVLIFAGIVFFICSVVAPLFYDTKMEAQPDVALKAMVTPPPAAPTAPAAPVDQPAPAESLAIGLDGDFITLWVIQANGQLSTFRTAGGEEVSRETIFDQPITAVAKTGDYVALGGRDGRVCYGRIESAVEYIELKDAAGQGTLPLPGQTVAWKDGVAQITAAKQLRIVRTQADLSAPSLVGDEPAAAIADLDYSFEDLHEHLVLLRADGRLYFDAITKTTNMMTGKVRREVERFELPAPSGDPAVRPVAVRMGLNGRMVFLVWADGRCVRYQTEEPEKAFIAEEVDLLPDPAARLAKLQLLNGNQTLIVTDSLGGVSGWFPAPFSEAVKKANLQTSKDSVHLVQAHVLENQGAAVTAVAASRRDRQFVTVDATGRLMVRHMTGGTTQGEVRLVLNAPPAQMAIAPENNAVAILDVQQGLHVVRLDNPHADGSLSGMFTKIWYEGYPEPQYVYQSSAGTDDAEPKFSLVPLIYGTLKATLYAMLFSVPIAILGAIYSSEFMHPHTRNVVKPVIEMMASLPSVVLGFIAAVVLAPLMNSNVMTVLLSFGLIPFGLLSTGFVWQLIPGPAARKIPAWQRFGLMIAIVLLMLGLSWSAGPWVESLMFGGSIKSWLSGAQGTATPGWIFLLTPLCFVALTLGFNLWIKPDLQLYQTAVAGPRLGLIELGRGALLIGAAILAAGGLGWGLSTAGYDLRGSLVGPYNDRNSLILGIIMGFAIIPIIYTVSEDALSAVPNTLRSAALGMGATQWQTAIRVVLPVALPGVFSACMIGFGRAAGETMIVLMASGRIPVIDHSPFIGLSPLSANIATELPEAPLDTTHYRMLFMSALVLFAITFVVNTIAEIIRLRYRKRSANL